MKRFLLSLAILVMACGLSFGQGAPGGGSGAGGLGTVQPNLGDVQTPAYLAAVHGPFLPPVFQGYQINDNVTFSHFIKPIRRSYPAGFVHPTNPVMAHPEIFLFAWPEMTPENNPLEANTYNTMIYLMLKNMEESKLPEDRTPTDNKILKVISYKCIASQATGGIKAGRNEIALAIIAEKAQLEALHVANKSWTDPATGTVHYPRIMIIGVKALTADAPTSYECVDKFHYTNLGNGTIKCEGHLIYFLEWPTIEGVGEVTGGGWGGQ